MALSRNLETFWAKILSEDREKILTAIRSLSEDEQRAVVDHLKRMAHETGWSEGQRSRAKTALSVLQE
jgi:hypothetical protein